METSLGTDTTREHDGDRISLTTTSPVDSTEDGKFCCSYCNVVFGDLAELHAHCRSQSHQSIIMSDAGRDWKYRPPPRGLSAEHYKVCQRFASVGSCRLGLQCCEAHSTDELAEWKERFGYRQMKIQRAREKQLHGSLYTEQLLENWMQSKCPQNIMKETLASVQVSVSSDLYVTMSAKRSTKDWTFTMLSKAMLHHVALLNDAHRTHFAVASITNMCAQNSPKNYNVEPSCQEWTNPEYVAFMENVEFEFQVQVSFKTDIFGTFRQTVVFDFGRQPVLVKHLCVDVMPVSELDKLVETRTTLMDTTARWDARNVELVPYEPKPFPPSEEDLGLLAFYPPPQASKLVVTQAVMDKCLTQENYTSRMHELLAIEEMAQYEQISRFNMVVKLQLISRYMLTPSTYSTAKYSAGGELFGRMKLGATLSEDTPAGRLVLLNCSTALVAPASRAKLGENMCDRLKVFEVLIEDKGKNFIYLRLSEKCVSELKLEADQDFHAEVQFQLNRLPLSEMHYAVDKLPAVGLVFPNVSFSPEIPWNPQRWEECLQLLRRQWSESLDSRLNPKQKEAILAISAPVDVMLPPILLIGPYGTGKTFTLAQGIKEVLLQPGTRVLVCTHSNSAADLYIREYLHPYVNEDHPEARPLRIYYRNRWVQTVHPTVLKYCLLSRLPQGTSFCIPTAADILDHRVIVATLSTSRYLAHLGLPKGFFTHILLDEAAQATECEVLMPMALACPGTRIVLAGDHMQLSPEVHSPFARERGLQISLLERLYDLYPSSFSCRILLCENYRSHDAIVQCTSELFYECQLVASGKQPRHEVFYPLTFFTARGEDVQDQNSTAFYNNSEVYEVVERVAELYKMWPKTWGSQDENSIGIVSPYADQVFRIRTELRKRRLHSISVERVLNVQGKQFRAVFLSTVRTRHTCTGTDDNEEINDYGFLSNAKLLNTAVTRAQSLVAVVGDPVALCSIGKCRKLWEKFIEQCHEHKSLYGITWSAIRAQLDGVELKKAFVLNPLAPEFIPNRLRHGEPFDPYNSYPPSQNAGPPSTWFGNRQYLPQGVYSPVYPYTYPLSYLYGLPPSYLGPPVVIPSVGMPPWGISNSVLAGKRPVVPHVFPQPRTAGGRSRNLEKESDSGGEKSCSPETVGLKPMHNGLTAARVRKMKPSTAQPRGGTAVRNKSSTERRDARRNGRETQPWTRNLPWSNHDAELSPAVDSGMHKQFQLLPGVHVPPTSSPLSSLTRCPSSVEETREASTDESGPENGSWFGETQVNQRLLQLDLNSGEPRNNNNPKPNSVGWVQEQEASPSTSQGYNMQDRRVFQAKGFDLSMERNSQLDQKNVLQSALLLQALRQSGGISWSQDQESVMVPQLDLPSRVATNGETGFCQAERQNDGSWREATPMPLYPDERVLMRAPPPIQDSWTNEKRHWPPPLPQRSVPMPQVQNNVPLYLRCSTERSDQPVVSQFGSNSSSSVASMRTESDPLLTKQLASDLLLTCKTPYNELTDDYDDSSSRADLQLMSNGYSPLSHPPLTYAGVVRATPPKASISPPGMESSEGKQTGLYRYFY